MVIFLQRAIALLSFIFQFVKFVAGCVSYQKLNSREFGKDYDTANGFCLAHKFRYKYTGIGE